MAEAGFEVSDIGSYATPPPICACPISARQTWGVAANESTVRSEVAAAEIADSQRLAEDDVSAT
jgi:hypothetical protein